MRRTLRSFYRYLFTPHSQDEDTQRREFIFTVLLFGALLLILLALSIMILHMIRQGSRYDGTSPVFLGVAFAVLASLYGASRKRFQNYQVYAFLLIFVFLATYSLYAYGYATPEGLLTYAMVTVMAGVLLSARAAFAIVALIGLCVTGIMFAETRGISQPDRSDMFQPIATVYVILYTAILIVMALVSWLSNRYIGLALARARHSEALLLEERNSLEDKVMRRTRQLELVQAEKLYQLHRFAEVGRVSATLLHELTNPLTSVSLELEQMDGKAQAEQLTQIKKGVSIMEQYVTAARRQLRSESEVKIFDCAEAIHRVGLYLKPRATRRRVKLRIDTCPDVSLKGDVIRFDQMLANLITNAIDSYTDKAADRTVTIAMNTLGSRVEIVVQDHGIGIKPGQLDKIFEPFFTTKPIDKGTGIGLSIARQAVEESLGGTIVVTSNKRIGTKFIVSLPRHEN